MKEKNMKEKNMGVLMDQTWEWVVYITPCCVASVMG